MVLGTIFLFTIFRDETAKVVGVLNGLTKLTTEN